MTVSLLGRLLFVDRRYERLLVAFDWPEHGLTLNKPCYIPEHAVRYRNYDKETGEICDGDAIFEMNDPLANSLPQLVAVKIREREHLTKIARQEAKKSNLDRMLTPRQAAKLKAQ